MKKQKTPAGPRIKTFKIAQLKAAGYNPRTIDEAALAGLTKSIERFGCVEPIVVNIRGGKNRIVGGHQRLKALQSLGIKNCVCVTVDCSAGDEKLLNLSLNNPLIQGQFIEDIGEHIEKLRGQISDDDELLLALRVEELREELKKILPNFEPVTKEEQPRLDEKAKVKCPKCGCEFTP